MNDLLDLAVRVATEAGREARAARDEAGRSAAGSLGVRTKANERDLVTWVDEACERTVRERLAESGIPVFGEEGGADRGAGDWLHAERVWIVDPIDGTTNFVHGLPHFGVAIGLLERGRPVLGVFRDPNAEETVWTVRGEGCFLEARDGSRRRLRVDDRPLAQGLIGVSLPSTEMERSRNASAILEVVRVCRNVRVLGSAATHLAYVAAGRLSACWDVRLSPWDMAAGWLMVEEAGGVVTDLAGRPFSLQQRTIVAGNPRLHGELLALLARTPAGAYRPAE